MSGHYKRGPGRKASIDSSTDGAGNYIRRKGTPFRARFQDAWNPTHARHTAWWFYCQNQEQAGSIGEPLYRPSYAMLEPFECEMNADRCLYLMDCYGSGGSHENNPRAKVGYITAQAAAISWLSR
jgi:hypothetical protein